MHTNIKHTINFNINPGLKILVIVQRENGLLKAVNLHWGLVPHWAKDPKSVTKLINARAETVAQKPSFRKAFQQQRCLIPATGFYEWQHSKDGKQAFNIHLPDYSLCAFAGLWEQWSDNQQNYYSCTIITTAAVENMQAIHHRMPVILAPQQYQSWLQQPGNIADNQQLLASHSHQNLIFSAISNRVNNPKHNDAGCLQ